MRLMRRTAFGTTALAVTALLAGCSGDGGGGERGARDGEPRSIVQALTAAAERAGEARTARVELTMSVPGAGGGMRMSGVTGWDPLVMDVTASGGMLGQAGGPDEVRMLWVDDVMYMNVGEEGSEGFGGKPWVKMDLRAIAERSGDGRALESMTGGLQDMNRSPSQQTALLLDSPSIERVGEEKVGGVPTEHYSGTLTMEEALAADSSSDHLTAEEREELLGAMEKSGVKGFDIDVWVDERDYPAKIDMTMDSPQGEITVSQTYSDYGTPVSVRAPSASETTDLMEALEEIGGAGREEAGEV
jgi:hypothetical protein